VRLLAPIEWTLRSQGRGDRVPRVMTDLSLPECLVLGPF
jgi:hypothetical protein